MPSRLYSSWSLPAPLMVPSWPGHVVDHRVERGPRRLFTTSSRVRPASIRSVSAHASAGPGFRPVPWHREPGQVLLHHPGQPPVEPGLIELVAGAVERRQTLAPTSLIGRHRCRSAGVFTFSPIRAGRFPFEGTRPGLESEPPAFAASLLQGHGPGRASWLAFADYFHALDCGLSRTGRVQFRLFRPHPNGPGFDGSQHTNGADEGSGCSLPRMDPRRGPDRLRCFVWVLAWCAP